MQRVYYDLHIHSCLSPCGDDDMTPANIAGMAAIKGLDVVALTDHNTARNCPAFLKFAEEYGIIAIPGMEMTTLEEVHVVCLFPTLDKALKFDKYVYEHFIPFPNDIDVFGKQEIYGIDDTIIGTEPLLLINAVDISFDKVYDAVDKFNGVMIPAHIDKSTTSLLSNLGFVPEDSRFKCVELKDMKKWHAVKEANPYLENCNVITDSDAHYLSDINEAVNSIYIKDKTIESALMAIDPDWRLKD